MKTLVEFIAEVKSNIEDLQEAEKKNAKALMALEVERDDIMANIAMFKKVLADLTSIKDEACNEIMETSTKKVEKKAVGIAAAKKVIATDEKGEIIAEYSSTAKAAKDLGVAQCTVSCRVRNMPKGNQLKKYGYALTFA